MDLPKFRVLAPETSVYLYYAGRGRKYMEISSFESRVFLDLAGVSGSKADFLNESRMVQAIHRADDVAKFLKDRNRNRPRSVSSYPSKVPSLPNGGVDRSFVADLANLKILLNEMSPGDIVIMTPDNHYDPLLIGEIVRS